MIILFEMASNRPKRSRKMVNYGEDHLHWVEETQLQKVLLRSLNDKGSPLKTSPDEKIRKVSTDDAIAQVKVQDGDWKDGDLLEDSKKVIKRKILSKSVLSDSANCPTEDRLKGKVDNVCEDSFELRLTRLQTKLLEEAGMLDPTTDSPHACPLNSKDNQMNVQTSRRELFDPDAADASDADENATASRVRAQRKFATNASPPSSCNNSPVKMHRQKVHRDVTHRKKGKQRAVRASSTSTDFNDLSGSNKQKSRKRRRNLHNQDNGKRYPPSLFEGIPNTDSFLDYICFRNTTVKVELHDCMKN